MKAPVLAAMLSLASSAPALAATFVYVSNAEDGDIGMYTLQADGSLQPGQRFKAEKLVMPMAVSPDKRFLVAAVRSKPFQAYSYGIDKTSGALNLVGTGPLAESYPYIALDRTGRFLLGASYGAHQVGGESGRRGRQGRRAHSGHPDGAQRARDPHRQHQPLCVRAAPRHRPGVPVRVRREDRTAHREHAAGPPAQAGHRAASSHRFARQPLRLPAQRVDRHGHHAVARREHRHAQGARLRAGLAGRHQARPRHAARRGRRARRAPRNTDNDIWASDLRLTPNGRFLYAAERTSSTHRRLPRRWRERQAHLSRQHADREAAPRIQRSIRPAASWSCPARSRT